MATGDVVREFRECRLSEQVRTQGFTQGVTNPTGEYFAMKVTSNLGDGVVELQGGPDFFPSDVVPTKTYTIKVIED